MLRALDHRLNEFIEDVRDAQDIDRLKDRLAHALSGIGFDWFGYVGLDRPLGSSAPSSELMGVPCVSINVGPPEWVDRYFEQAYWDEDPMMLESLRTTLPFRWNKMLEEETLSLRGRQILREAAECGLHDGFTVPVLDHGGKIGLLSVSSKEPRDDLDSPLTSSVHAVHLLSIYFHAAVQGLVVNSQNPLPKSILRPREVECLQWTARGKTAWEISMILKVSERTVNFHLGNAMRKLGVYNKTHAVAKMLVTGVAAL
ncbi:MAG: LuxR family transcriptional regulator [Rhodospirillales bacterium]|nr:LuxR family transcriptional regulator [Rhodospirillales bacterium]